ncbi:MAG: hypothetical protein NVSMB64_04560 [Candidatus Velthaea sp.]
MLDEFVSACYDFPRPASRDNKGPGYMDIFVLPKDDFGIESGDVYAGFTGSGISRSVDKTYIRKVAVSADSST